MFGNKLQVDIPQVNPMVGLLGQRSSDLMNSAWAQSSAMQANPQPQLQPQIRAMVPSEEGYQSPQSPSYNDGSGFNDNVPRSLIGTESGGNWFAKNNERGSGGKNGHFGILQFGHDRLTDAKNAGVIPQDMTPEQFMKSEQAQISSANWHFDDIDNRIRKNGYDRLIGQNVGGVTMSWDGMRSMAHLGGFGGLSKFITSGGKSNPSDSFGTSLSAYGKTHQS